jgi:exosortase H (IPTLxxWG-CTERM-specific)
MKQSKVPRFDVRPCRFLLLFVIFMIVGFGLLVAPFLQPAIVRFSRFLVAVSASLIHLCGGHAKMDGVILFSPANGFGVEMQNGCNGINVTILLWAAIAAFPASRKWQAVGLVGGTMALQGVNLLRFISLFYLGRYSMTLFDFVHRFLWEALIMLDAMVVFCIWAQASLTPARSLSCA